jgi:hypothetical protein
VTVEYVRLALSAPRGLASFLAGHFMDDLVSARLILFRVSRQRLIGWWDRVSCRCSLVEVLAHQFRRDWARSAQYYLNSRGAKSFRHRRQVSHS